MNGLTETCRHRGPEDRLQGAALAAALADLPGWQAAADGTGIQREFKLADYAAVLALVNAVAAVAQRQDHHPEVCFGYNRCRVSFGTHSAGGVTANDLICAAWVNHFAGG
jgi:4a-hydroxytetrahydrobiopterin dehydratase